MINCKDCRFWDKPIMRGWLGICRLISRNEDGYSLAPINEEEIAEVTAQELPADLNTSPEFGCVLGETKE